MPKDNPWLAHTTTHQRFERTGRQPCSFVAVVSAGGQQSPRRRLRAPEFDHWLSKELARHGSWARSVPEPVLLVAKAAMTDPLAVSAAECNSRQPAPLGHDTLKRANMQEQDTSTHAHASLRKWNKRQMSTRDAPSPNRFHDLVHCGDIGLTLRVGSSLTPRLQLADALGQLLLSMRNKKASAARRCRMPTTAQPGPTLRPQSVRKTVVLALPDTQQASPRQGRTC